MNDDTLRRLVEERWTALEAEQTTGERRLRVSHLPVHGNHNLLTIGVDHEGHRHVLVPVHAHRKIRPGLDGPVLQLRKRALEDEDTYQTYADLACLRDDLNDLFTELCMDVMAAAGELPENPVKALYCVLDRWKSLFRTQEAPLGPEQLAGLFGELILLNRLLERDSSAYRIWRGPEGHHHDFSTGVTAVEVKASTATEGRRPQIHGLDQLEAPDDGELCLVWFRLQRTTVNGSGTGIVELVDRTLRLCDDEVAVLDLLAQVGYRSADADRYHDVRFLISEEQWYSVSAGFPGLTGRALIAAGVPISILDVEYTIDLSGETPASMEPGDVHQVMNELIQESV
ncbi:PD-(D/E)XK motif protein [Streptomyces scabiei]|uniref:PD-(D/E)XK motif protein n=1 Tax=Streptomyces scabiei TaxID=1930 RepID=UPI001B30B1C0|nr:MULTISPECIES: PD-(D/E)XK motif protein [Streptomyces]MBP5876031.1 PD-(D/E)XK motif protein [Streptomyces sp. LBUM 1477]MBP5883761.1 PD-(D/E)XK motif protein [Streptomyces sp. LBUM 1487]MDX2629023.1 PD-(D/E)XK motif protein [Streptomyces scabiei]MDX3168002.1 PD-(D/E)XK motif protein [Streptomyces scabiei]QTU46269.1 PD-(D/E)XK motif protein [Streptomyces sp. LBUM 1482]